MKTTRTFVSLQLINVRQILYNNFKIINLILLTNDYSKAPDIAHLLIKN